MIVTPMTASRRIRRLLACTALVIAVAAMLAAGLAAAGSGFTLRAGGLRLSLRTPLNPALIALAAAVLAWLGAGRDDRQRARTRLVAASPYHLASWSAGALAAGVTLTAVLAGSFVASGADAYGYLSQADNWRHGVLVVPQAFAREMTWPFAAESLAPLGYLPWRVAGVPTPDLAPIYSPGHPLILALLQLMGGPLAKFAVVPLLSGVAIWATYLLGRRFAGPLAGLIAAFLLACSPTFLFEAVSPTSDAPSTAWWALTLASLLLPGRLAILGAGVTAGIAILTRPNIVFLAGILGVWLLWESRRARLELPTRPEGHAGPEGHASAWPRSIWPYAACVALACFAIALLNRHLYGSPLQSGYGPFTTLFNWTHLAPNLVNYPRWLLENETPFMLLAIVAVVWPRRAMAHGTAAVDARATTIAWSSFIAALVTLYLFYIPQFSSLRFLLPAYPPLLVLASAGLLTLLGWGLGRGSDPFAKNASLWKTRLAALTPVLALVAAAAVGWHGLAQARSQGIFTYWKSELRYHTLGDYVATTLPERAAILSMQHSGSIRYYSGRLTVRYDWIPPADLDTVLARLRTLGYQPYLALDQEEEETFRERFRGHSALAPLDWIPMAVIHANRVRVYDLTDREAGRPDRQRVPDVIPNPADQPWSRWHSAR